MTDIEWTQWAERVMRLEVALRPPYFVTVMTPPMVSFYGARWSAQVGSYEVARSTMTEAAKALLEHLEVATALRRHAEG